VACGLSAGSAVCGTRARAGVASPRAQGVGVSLQGGTASVSRARARSGAGFSEQGGSRACAGHGDGREGRLPAPRDSRPAQRQPDGRELRAAWRGAVGDLGAVALCEHGLPPSRESHFARDRAVGAEGRGSEPLSSGTPPLVPPSQARESTLSRRSDPVNPAFQAPQPAPPQRAASASRLVDRRSSHECAGRHQEELGPRGAHRLWVRAFDSCDALRRALILQGTRRACTRPRPVLAGPCDARSPQHSRQLHR